MSYKAATGLCKPPWPRVHQHAGWDSCVGTPLLLPSLACCSPAHLQLGFLCSTLSQPCMLKPCPALHALALPTCSEALTSGPRPAPTTMMTATSVVGAMSHRAWRMASSYFVYLMVSRSKVSYVEFSRLSCRGCRGACGARLHNGEAFVHGSRLWIATCRSRLQAHRQEPMVRAPAVSCIEGLVDWVKGACMDACSSRQRATHNVGEEAIGKGWQGLHRRRLGKAEGCSQRGPESSWSCQGSEQALLMTGQGVTAANDCWPSCTFRKYGRWSPDLQQRPAHAPGLK